MKKLTRACFVVFVSVLLFFSGALFSVTSSYASTLYDVLPGDTLSAIAARFQVTVQSLVIANHIANPDLIYPGQMLVIPSNGYTGGSSYSSLTPKVLFQSAISKYVATRLSSVSVAVYDAKTNRIYSYFGNHSYITASIIKATIMADLLHHAQVAKQPLTAQEQQLMPSMIEYSNNSDASALWDLAGRSGGIQSFLHLIGMNHTVAGTDGYWGLTETTALDQITLLRDFAYPNKVLTPVSRNYALHLMENVVSYEHWGISGGVPGGVTVALKNGWVPSGSNWEINSIGFVNGPNRNYCVAVLTNGNPSESYGIQTIDAISSMIWQAFKASK